MSTSGCVIFHKAVPMSWGFHAGMISKELLRRPMSGQSVEKHVDVHILGLRTLHMVCVQN